MPVTFAHPAAVLPFMGGPCVPAALVAGALAPDAPYFLRALRIPVSAQSWWEPFLNATTTHNWPGALIITIPLAFFLYAFIVACARPALWVLPESGSTPKTPQRAVAIRGVWVVISLLIGILTHVIWDSLTHSDGWVVMQVTALRAEAMGTLTWARLLQHVSSAVGLGALVAVGWVRRNSWLPSAENVRRVRFFRVLAALSATAILGAITVGAARYDSLAPMDYHLTSIALGAGLGALVATVTLSTMWWAIRPDRATQQSRDIDAQEPATR